MIGWWEHDSDDRFEGSRDMNRPSWAPAGVDLDRPSAARVYDYFLGGTHNVAVDRELAQQIARMTPNIGDTMRANRAFLRRAVRYLWRPDSPLNPDERPERFGALAAVGRKDTGAGAR